MELGRSMCNKSLVCGKLAAGAHIALARLQSVEQLVDIVLQEVADAVLLELGQQGAVFQALHIPISHAFAPGLMVGRLTRLVATELADGRIKGHCGRCHLEGHQASFRGCLGAVMLHHVQ